MSEVGPKDHNLRAAEYVLRLLVPAEERVFERELRDDRELQADVAGWVLYFEELNNEFPEVVPPRSVKSVMMARLFGENAPTTQTLWKRVWLWQGVSAVALVLVAVLALQNLLATDTIAPSYVAEIVAEDDSLRLLAVFDPNTGGLQITRTAGAAPLGRVLELWAIKGDAAPVSLGVLPDDTTTRVTIPPAFQTPEGLTLAISDEPPGGSPTGAPTGTVLAIGQTYQI